MAFCTYCSHVAIVVVRMLCKLASLQDLLNYFLRPVSFTLVCHIAMLMLLNPLPAYS